VVDKDAPLITDAGQSRTVPSRIAALQRTPAGRAALYAIAVALVALAYYLAGRVGLELAYFDGAVAAMWPPAGVGLAVLFLYGPRMVPGIVIGDLLLADFSTPLGTVLAQTVGNTVALVVAAELLRRLTDGRGGLDRVRDVLAFIACALVAALVSAAFGPTALWLGDVISDDELGRVFRTWTLGDAAGVLVVAPAVLTWAVGGIGGVRRRDLVEAAVLLVLLVVLAELPPQRDVPYVVFPALLWAALRFGPRGAATAFLVVCSITVWNTSQDAGPFVRDSVTDSLLATQLFIAIAAVTSLLLAAVTAERTRAARAAAAAEAAQHALAKEQAALRRVATLVAGDAPPSRVFEQVTEEVGRLLGLPGANVMQYDGVRTATVVGAWSEHGQPRFPVGAELDIDGDTVLARVVRSGAAARVDRYDQTSGELAAAVASAGYRGAVAAPVHVGGRLWGVLAAASTSDEPLPEGIEQQLCDFAELVAQALANADAYEKLAASRARLVAVGDAERQRLERNLHDGAQQRLVSVALGLGMVASRLESDPAAARELLATAQGELARGLDELRELARGIHPAMLTDRGLGAALDALAARAPVPVEVTAVPEERLAAPVEAAVYYVVAEAITNVAKYAQASSATVTIARANGAATVLVSDDGVGGADPAGGSGLRGLAARVEALNGRLDVDSPPGGGTRITAEIPLA
jgi:signal transduction histidine kinase